MTTPVWPPGLPQNAVFPPTEALQPNYIETDMDPTFAPKRRPRTTGQTKKYSLSVVGLNPDQKETLEQFYFTTLHGGNDVFTWVNPLTGASQNFVFDGAISFSMMTQTVYAASFSLRTDPT